MNGQRERRVSKSKEYFAKLFKESKGFIFKHSLTDIKIIKFICVSNTLK